MVFALGSERPKCSTFPALIRSLTVAGHVFDWHCEIDAMLIVEIDAIGPEALERFLDDAPDALRPAVQSVRAIDLEAELGSDGNLVADPDETRARGELLEALDTFITTVRRSGRSPRD